MSFCFLDADVITSETKLVLVNVLKISSSWHKSFTITNSSNSMAFNVEKLDKIGFCQSVQISNGEIGYLKTISGTEIVSLPLNQADYEMVFIKPANGMTNFVDIELPEVLSEIIEGDLPKERISVTLPIFSLETKYIASEFLKEVSDKTIIKKSCIA